MESPCSGLRWAEGHAARLGSVPTLESTWPSLLSPSRGVGVVVEGGGVAGGGVAGGGVAGQYAGAIAD
jgi:hypothetical protein